MPSNNLKFTIKVVGDVTGEEFKGVFEARANLPFALQLEQDKLRRQLLGERPEYAPQRVGNIAEILATLGLHITKGPKWWNESNGGLTLEDDNVLAAIYDGYNAEAKKFYDELKAKKDEAEKALAAVPPPEET